MTPTEEKLIELAKRRFQKPDLSVEPDADLFEALGINSFRALELLTEVEDHFEIELPDYELQEVRSFRDLAGAVDKRL